MLLHPECSCILMPRIALAGNNTAPAADAMDYEYRWASSRCSTTSGFIREAPRVWAIEAVGRLKMRDEGRFARSRLRAHALELDKRAAGFIRPPGVRPDECVVGPVRAQPVASPPP